MDNKRKILVVDDDEMVRRTIMKMVKVVVGENTYVMEAENGKVALKLVEKCGYDFDAIITDFDMPLMNGISFLERAILLSPRSKRIIMTGNSVLDYHEEVLLLGARLLMKPFVMAELKQALLE